MKNIILAVATLLLVNSAHAQSTAEPVTVSPSITLSGKTVGMSRDVTTTWQAPWGSFNKEATSRRCLAITMSTVARLPQKAKVQVLFLFRNQGSKDLEIESTDAKEATAENGKPAIMTVDIITEDTYDKYVALGAQAKSGQRYVGWAARAIDANGNIAGACGSTTAYARYAYEAR
jgi:hypothetical protein